MIGSLTERHFLPMMTPAALLRRIGRIDFDELSASFFRFARQSLKELRPCRVTDALGKAMGVNHAIDVQVFHADHAVGINNATAFLMREIVTPECYSFMNTRYGFTVLRALRCSLCQLRMGALHVCQGFFFLAKERGVVDCCSIGKRGKRLESDINADTALTCWQAFRLTLNREGNGPLARPALVNGTRFDTSLDGSMVHHLEGTNLGKRHTAIMRQGKTGLREAKTIVAIMPTKPRIARRFPGFHAAEEGLEGQINAHSDVLQHLGMHRLEGRTVSFQYRECGDLPVAGQTLPTLLIGILAVLQQVVIEPTTLIKGLIELLNLLLGRIQAIRKHFMHTQSLAQKGRGGKSSIKPRAHHAPQGLASIPMASSRGLTLDVINRKIAGASSPRLF